jgi:hypothetical protein
MHIHERIRAICDPASSNLFPVVEKLGQSVNDDLRVFARLDGTTPQFVSLRYDACLVLSRVEENSHLEPLAMVAHQGIGHDDRVRQGVLNSLRNSGYWTLSRLECVVTDGMVVLSGSVSSYYLKQMAQTLVLRNTEIKIFENRIEVRSEQQ